LITPNVILLSVVLLKVIQLNIVLLYVILVNVVLLYVILFNVTLLSVVLLNVMAPVCLFVYRVKSIYQRDFFVTVKLTS
jgi:hypothetical protein